MVNAPLAVLAGAASHIHHLKVYVVNSVKLTVLLVSWVLTPIYDALVSTAISLKISWQQNSIHLASALVMTLWIMCYLVHAPSSFSTHETMNADTFKHSCFFWRSSSRLRFSLCCGNVTVTCSVFIAFDAPYVVVYWRSLDIEDCEYGCLTSHSNEVFCRTHPQYYLPCLHQSRTH